MKIITYPNAILDMVAKPVILPLQNDEIQLIKQMWQIVQGIGVGLAAPQVSESKQIFIVHLGEDRDFRKKYKTPDFVVINPKITFQSKKMVNMIEGCLSFPEEYWSISRPETIQIEYTTISNFLAFVNINQAPKYKKEKLLANGWLSRVLQHEYDHLNGKIFINMGGKKLTKKQLTDLEESIVD